MHNTKNFNGVQEQTVTPYKEQVTLLISQAIDKNVPVETMERLLAMRRELKAEYAREAYDKAMTEFQAECPIIKKTKSVFTKTGKKAYSFAPLESIVEQVKQLLTKHGFSYAVQTETKIDKVKATCIVKHKLGHCEFSSFEVPLGNKTEIMSQTQVVAAALTFAKRYSFCNGFGILTSDEDTDASPISSAEADMKTNTNTIGKKINQAEMSVADKPCSVCHAPINKVHATNCSN